MSSPTPQISLIIPCFNEADGIAGTVGTIRSYMQEEQADHSYEIILIDDGSSDGTGEILKELSEEHENVRSIHFPYNRGRGAAFRAGISTSKGDHVIALDADLSYDEKHIGSILKCFEEDPRTDVVVVSPYMKGGSSHGVPWGRLFVSRMANWILGGFFAGKLKTVTCVVRGYRGSLIRAIPLFEEGKEIHLEVLRKLALYGARIVEIPGRLRWQRKTTTSGSRGRLRFVSSAQEHVWYALMIKPARVFKYFAFLLLFVGVYESFNILRSFLGFYDPAADERFWRCVWVGLSKSFSYSPHTYGIASVSLILSFITFSYLAILHVLRLQQEETMRHLMAVLERRPPPQDSS